MKRAALCLVFFVPVWLICSQGTGFSEPAEPSAIEVGAALLVSETAETGAAAGWRAGIGRAVITPAEPMWMSGYASRNHPAEGTLHDLWVKCLALSSSQGQTCLLITADLIGIPDSLSAELTQMIEQEHGIDRASVMICTSHTHTGPMIHNNLSAMVELPELEQQKVVDYSRQLVGKILSSVRQAMADREPVTLSWGIGGTGFAVNRRNNPERDVPKLREQGVLAGPVDHDVPVLKVLSGAGELKSVVFGYACHCTVLSFYQWSGDYAGFAQIALEKKFPGTSALFFAGCGGDQNPLPRRTVELARKYGNQLANAVAETLGGDLNELAPTLRTAYRTVDLEYDSVPSKDQVKAALKSQNKYETYRAKLLLAQYEQAGALATSYAYPTQVWRLGEKLIWVALGGEVVVDYSLRLKKQIGASSTWVAGYSNDVMAYIPSERVLKEGGYEGGSSMVYYGLPSKWATGVEDKVVDSVMSLVRVVRAR